MDATAKLPIVWKSKATPSEYERARIGRVFNLRRPERYPVAVVEVTNEDDVVEAVKLAKEQKARISIRSGGHSWAAWSVRDNAILIDFGNFKHMQLDQSTNVITVSPSTTGRVLNGYLGTKGLLFPGGHCPDVGVGGFLLQGGMGWNCRSWGWACTNVKAIDVVTVEGKKLHCDERENNDLFWAARGAGPGFPAIVTKFHLQARPLPTCIRSSGYVYAKADFKKALNWIKEITPDFDPDTENVCVGLYMPQYEESVVFILLLTFKWTEKDAVAALQAAEDTHPEGCLEKWFAKDDSLEQQYCNQADANPNEHRYCCDNAYIGNDEDVATVLEDAFMTLPSRKSFSLWYAMAPVSRRPLPDMALSMHSDHYFALYTVWEDEKDDARCQAWVRKIMKNVEPHSVGAYLGDSDFQARRSKYWSDENCERLRMVRKKWDPDGLICGYLDAGDQSGITGLPNKHEWVENRTEDGLHQDIEKLRLEPQNGALENRAD